MLESFKGWINQNGNDDANTGSNSKFGYIFNQPPGNTTSSVKLDLVYVNAYGRPIRSAEYGTSTRPLSSITVNRTNIAAQDFFGYGLGYSNHTNFINAILGRHNLYSRLWPMGPTNPTGSGPLGIACNLSVAEEFALTFIETPTNIPGYTDPTIYHIETLMPMTIRSYVDKVAGGFDGLKSNIESAIINGLWRKTVDPNLTPPV
jgi:hypothetical protein